MQNSSPPPAYHIASVDHALCLLLLLRTSPTVRVAEAAEFLNVARSTAHRLLTMLVYRGFAAQDPGSRAYRLGPVLIEVGMGALANLDVRRKARPFIERLVEETGETASLQILEGRQVRFIDSIESTNAVRVGSRLGVNLPAHASSGGKVLLAPLSAETLARLYPDEELEALTHSTTTSRRVLFSQLAVAREQQYSVNYEETEAGLVAVGVPVGQPSHPVAALTVAGPTARMTPERVQRVVEALRRAAAELTARLYD
jgi:DNA-binding IclR family transcriptional regulator